MYIFQYLLIYDIIIFIMREQYIEKRIRKNLIKSVVLPILFIGVLIDALLLLNIQDLARPPYIKDVWSYFEDNKDIPLKGQYLKTKIYDLHYTGFDLTNTDKKIGSFYYNIKNSNCILVLIDSSQYAGGKPPAEIKEYKLCAKILKSNSLNTELINNIANQISWNSDNLKDNISEYVISEPDYNMGKLLKLATFIVFLMIISIIYIFYKIVLIINPHLIRSFNILNRYGNKNAHIRRANTELTNKVSEYLNHAYITTNYYIDLSKYKPMIIPLRDIDSCKYLNRRKRKSTILVKMSHGDIYKVYDRTYSDYKKISKALSLVKDYN